MFARARPPPRLDLVLAPAPRPSTVASCALGTTSTGSRSAVVFGAVDRFAASSTVIVKLAWTTVPYTVMDEPT